MPDIYTQAQLHRQAVLARDTVALQRVTSAYLPIFNQLQFQLSQLTAQIEEAARSGQRISKAWLARQERYQSLLAQIAVQIDRYAQGVVVPGLTAEQRTLVNLAQLHANEALASQSATLFTSFNRLPVGAIEQFIGFAGDGTPLNKLLKRYGRDVAVQVRDTLLNGVVTGQGVQKTARAVEQLIDRPRWEAARLVRTESLRSYRESSRATYADNGITTWIWLSSKSLRTCASCLALDQQEFPIDKPMPAHPSCRCTVIPKLDNMPARQTAAEWLAQQSAEDQAKVLGVSGAKAYRDGLPLQNWIGVSKSKQWGEMRYQRSLADAQKGPQRGALPAPAKAKPHAAPKPAPVMPAPKPSLLSELQAPAQNVSVAVHGKKGREGLVKFLGRDFTDTEIAQAFGALDGAKVDIFEALDTYAIEITHPQIKSQERHLMRDGQGRLVIHNDLFLAAKDAPRGIGLRSFTRQVFGARKLGIDRIETFAAGSARSAVITEGQSWNGYYTWARFGYNGALTAQDLRDLPVEFQDVRDLHELFGRPGGAEAWKEFGSGHEMEFDLGPQSRSIDRLIEYVKGKERERK